MYLGVDIGTSALKVVLVDENGKTVRSCSNDLSVQRPRPGWSEQDPHSWWQAADHAVKALHLTCAKQLQHVRGIGPPGHDCWRCIRGFSMQKA